MQGPQDWVQGAGARLRPGFCPIGLLSFPGPGGGQAVGTQEGRREAGCEGAAGAVWYSHYQPSSEGQPSRPLATVAAFTPPLCLLTQGRLPQGRRCRLGNEGVQGPPKQPSSRPLRNPRAYFWSGGGGGRLQVTPPPPCPWRPGGKTGSMSLGWRGSEGGSWRWGEPWMGPSLQEP